MTRYLGQVVAIEADQRKTADQVLTQAYHALEKPAMMEGIEGEYKPAVDDGEPLPKEELRVQVTVEEMIKTTREELAKLFDATAARDFTNASGRAKADVQVGDQVLIEGAPVPYLLWLERKLDDLTAFVRRIPTHSAATTWSLAEERGVWASEPVKTARQVQEPKVITLAAATQQHQAQTQLHMAPVIAGTWTRVKFSGAVPVSRREEMLRRLSTLRSAVHVARVEANRCEAEEPTFGPRVLSYLFDPS